MRRNRLARVLERRRDSALAAMREAPDWPWRSEPDPDRRELIRLDGELQALIDWLESEG